MCRWLKLDGWRCGTRTRLFVYPSQSLTHCSVDNCMATNSELEYPGQVPERSESPEPELTTLEDGEGQTMTLMLFKGTHVPGFPSIKDSIKHRHDFLPRPDDVWVSSFPKSGKSNTQRCWADLAVSASVNIFPLHLKIRVRNRKRSKTPFYHAYSI